MTMRFDDKPAAYLESPGLEHATKNAIGFTVRGKSTLMTSAKTWESAESTGWRLAAADSSPPSIRRTRAAGGAGRRAEKGQVSMETRPSWR